MNQNLKTSILTVTICAVFITGNYLHAQWSNPTNNPPTANVAAPINTSSSNQFKADGGRIGADQLVAFERARADEYCDLAGDNCFSSALPVCDSDNQALGWDGSSWVCNSIDGGTSGGLDLDLVNGLHSSEQCENLGGEVLVDDGGNRFCRFASASCPSGWSNYDNWRQTSSRTCSAGFCSCRTGGQSWSQHARPSCFYDTRGANDTQCSMGLFRAPNCFAAVTRIGCY